MFNTFSKIIRLAGALVASAALSQYPAFTQDYIQRLGGTVDALTDVVDDFDRSALAAGLTRGEALADMTGSAFLDARAADMRETFIRQATLTDQLSRLRAASPFERITLAPALRDGPTLQATWGDFEPALPLSPAGAATGVIGFIAGWAGVASLLALLKLPFRRARPRRTPQRIDPPLLRPVATPPTPRLPGETRPH